MTDGNGSASRSARVLVVEDEFLIADHLAMTLEDLGYDVVGPVSTIDEALAVIRDQALDAALLDANLDGVSSAAIAKELSARAVPFVVVTGYGGLPLESAILDDAPRVAKPLVASKLAGALAESLARRGRWRSGNGRNWRNSSRP
ncbi:putative two-component response regulator [Sphingomonas changbaiensis NBRC 104936]|uniref:Putative two-component response regulator n=1 Tax=Sphingomonas changbaiensis NBRC 104936 TaxID=1219043 RepID=A0A0E9MPW8_9SPHN|nr:response regulator [Sphingomonas changbaiensis]GAO39538.1 putative two-component response regulator [Sphingomonas changbaiensis NBRC 104936]